MQFTADHAHVGEHYPDPEHLDEHGLPYVEWTILDVDTFTPAQGHEPDVLLTSDGPYVRGGTTFRALVSRADYRDLDTGPDAHDTVMFVGVPLPGVLPTTHVVGGWTAEEIATAHQRRLDRSERWLHDTRDLVAASHNRHSAESVMTWAADQGLVLTAGSGVLSVESRPTSSCDEQLRDLELALDVPAGQITVPLALLAGLLRGDASPA